MDMYTIQYDVYFKDLNKIIASRFRYPEDSIAYYMKTYIACKTGKRAVEHEVAEYLLIPAAPEMMSIAMFNRYMKGDIGYITLIIDKQHRVNSVIKRKHKIAKIRNDLEQFLTENNIEHKLFKDRPWDIDKYATGFIYKPGGDWLRVCYDVDTDTYISHQSGQDDHEPVHGFDKLLDEIRDFVG